MIWVGSSEGWYAEPFAVIAAGFVLLSTFNGAVLFGSEKNGLKFDMLLSTPLSTSRIVLTKLASGLLTPEAGIAAALALAAVRGWYSAAGWGGSLVAGMVSLIFLGFGYAVGAAASLYSRTVRTAIVLSVGLIGMLAAGLPWIASTMDPKGAGSGFLRVAACLDVLGVLEGFRDRSIDFGAAWQRAMVFSGIFTGLILAILAAIFHRFRRLTGRS
jgi:ABC-type transport system involved in multi-copper enzyme maturation permease subunit